MDTAIDTFDFRPHLRRTGIELVEGDVLRVENLERQWRGLVRRGDATIMETEWEPKPNPARGYQMVWMELPVAIASVTSPSSTVGERR